MNRRSKVVLSVVGAIGFVTVASVIGFIVAVYVTNRTFEHTLATNLNVSNEWIEISPEPLLQTRRMVSEIAIALPNYRDDRRGFEIKLSDGRIINPEIELIDVSGNVLELGNIGFNYTGSYDLIVFTPKGGVPKGEYKTLRIRSDEPFTLDRMFWRERNLK